MKKLLFTLFGLMQMGLVMAAAPAVSNNGNGDQSRQQNASIAAHMRPAQINKSLKPWLIVAVNGEGMMPSENGGDPKWLLRDEYENPLHSRVGRPKGKYVEEYESKPQSRTGRPKGPLVAEAHTPAPAK